MPRSEGIQLQGRCSRAGVKIAADTFLYVRTPAGSLMQVRTWGVVNIKNLLHSGPRCVIVNAVIKTTCDC